MMSKQRSALTEGDIVPILAGPFAGFRATIEAISEDKRTLKLILRVFGQKQAVEIFLMDVEKAA